MTSADARATQPESRPFPGGMRDAMAASMWAKWNGRDRVDFRSPLAYPLPRATDEEQERWAEVATASLSEVVLPVLRGWEQELAEMTAERDRLAARLAALEGGRTESNL